MKAWRFGAAWRWAGWLAAGAAAIGYALLANRAVSVPSPGYFEAAVIVSPILLLSLIMAWRAARRGVWLAAWIAVCLALVLASRQVAAGTHWILLLEHVGVNATLCAGFGRTLAPGAQPLVSRLAEIVHDGLSPRQAQYTRRVTWAWTCYFGATAATSSLLFALAPLPVWSAFVTLLSFPLLVIMFAVEYLVRIVVIPRGERAGLFESVAAYRRFAQRKAR